MLKTSKSKANKWFDENYTKNAAYLFVAIRTAYKGDGKMDGLYCQFGKSKYKRIKALKKHTHSHESFVDFFLSEEVLRRVFDTESNKKEIKYLPVYQWLIYLLAEWLYEGVTGKDFDADPDQNFKLLKQVSKKKVDKLMDVVVEVFVEEVLNKE